MFRVLGMYNFDQGKNCESPFSFFNFVFKVPNSEYNHAASTVNNKVIISANERTFEPHILLKTKLSAVVEKMLCNYPYNTYSRIIGFIDLPIFISSKIL